MIFDHSARGAATCLALLIALAPDRAAAQPEYFPTPTVGVRGGYAFTQESPFVGLATSVPLANRVEIIFGGDLVIDGVDERWRIGADVVIRVGPVGEWYVGGGASMSDFERPGTVGRDSQIGYALAAGYERGREPAWVLRPFIEPRWTFVDSRSFFMLAVGVNYALELPF